jgi:membrane-associated phospholipid phosphatase
VFQTEPVLALQSLATDWLTALMYGVTQAGYSVVYTGIILAIAFGASFRSGFVLAYALILAGLLTGMLKEIAALPRPSDVDARVMVDGVQNTAPFGGGGGQHFFDLPDSTAVAALRAEPGAAFGFPSGHVSAATAFWGGAALAFPSPATFAAASVMVPLMGVSRMYLGRHFLADVLGGIATGAVVLALLYRGFLAAPRWMWSPRWLGSLPLLALAAVTIVPRYVDAASAGRLAGLGAAAILLGVWGFPQDGGTAAQRLARVGLGAGVYWTAAAAIGLVLAGLGLDADARWPAYLGAGLTMFAVYWGTVWLARRLGLYAGPARVPAAVAS